MTGAAPSLELATDSDADTAVIAMYRRHRLDMIRLARVVVGERDAQDVVQEAFVDLHQHWGRVRDRDRALPYLRSCVLNRCRSRLRSQERTRRREQPPPGLAAPSAETEVVLAEGQRLMLARLRELPRRQREVLVLRYWSELSETEIAAALGISRGAVKGYSSRGLAALRAESEELR